MRLEEVRVVLEECRRVAVRALLGELCVQTRAAMQAVSVEGESGALLPIVLRRDLVLRSTR